MHGAVVWLRVLHVAWHGMPGSLCTCAVALAAARAHAPGDPPFAPKAVPAARPAAWQGATGGQATGRAAAWQGATAEGGDRYYDELSPAEEHSTTFWSSLNIFLYEIVFKLH